MTCLLVGVGVTTAVATHGWSAFLKVLNITEKYSVAQSQLTTTAAAHYCCCCCCLQKLSPFLQLSIKRMRGGGEALTFKCVILDTKENVQKKYFLAY